MIKKILIFTIIILVLIAVALGIQIYLDRAENSPVVEDEGSGGGIFGFLGFGGSDDAPADDVTPADIDQNAGDRETFVPTLRQISEDPVSGATFVGTTTIRYVDRGNGHIFQTGVDSGLITKISNTTLPKVYRAHWLDDESVVFQQLDGSTVKSKLVTLLNTENATSTEISVQNLEDNIQDIATSPLAYINRNGDVVVGGSTTDLPGKEWLVSWLDGNTLLLTTKASYASPGYSYTLSNSLNRILGEIDGLTTKGNSDWILYSSGLGLSVLDLETDSTRSLNPGTLPEKCVFSGESEAICGAPSARPAGQYPDDWYKGIVSFDDQIVRYNLEIGVSEVIYELDQGIDILDPTISSDGKYLLFKNKKDLSLWSLDLTKI